MRGAGRVIIGGRAVSTAAIVIDAWKLPIFKKHLDAAGYTYTEGPRLSADTLTLTVAYEWAAKLQVVVEAANKECAEQNKNGEVQE